MATIPANSIDTVITDPPYGVLGDEHEWDQLSADFHTRWAVGAYRVAKRGALALVFAHPTTWHRMACAIEDAGWRLIDTLIWLKGKALPKSHDIGKLVGAAGGDGARWSGWHSRLRPQHEPILVFEKAVYDSLAENAMRFGVAGFAIDRARQPGEAYIIGRSRGWHGLGRREKRGKSASRLNTSGRWPGNVIVDSGLGPDLDAMVPGASSWFVCIDGERRSQYHPTAKPLPLMRWLCRLTSTPVGGKVLDPFAGSGTTGVAALAERRRFIGIEREAAYVAVARKRLGLAARH
jgi:site-specific DNA-methyltransferase (adenine-specific)